MKKLGRKHRPFFRICAMDSRKPRDGRAIEELGHYDPMVRDKSQRVTLNLERIEYWLSVGATPSDKVAVLIKKVKANNWGEASAPPPLTPPKAPPEPEPEAPAEDAEATTEEAAEATAETEEKLAEDAATDGGES
ncbi:MAG: 30S ribosomal protein S16 [Planctomycetaceae bacterium]|nr:30S ribosomal protein S16 [Planctomycetaceae bacterium]MBT6157262.1 30S ribosomal protein S16 [Planctomycetaceae bacterium]MBT6486784.1 30S ribosomal protein S16 [Planctomycetaceae bacterium]MBT6493371.1 30S ribosomal protein S16 [Planctomycetaceae bacterium]